MRQKKNEREERRCSASRSRVQSEHLEAALAVLAAQLPEEPDMPGRALTPSGPTGRGAHHHGADCQLACPKRGWLLRWTRKE